MIWFNSCSPALVCVVGFSFFCAFFFVFMVVKVKVAANMKLKETTPTWLPDGLAGNGMWCLYLLRENVMREKKGRMQRKAPSSSCAWFWFSVWRIPSSDIKLNILEWEILPGLLEHLWKHKLSKSLSKWAHLAQWDTLQMPVRTGVKCTDVCKCTKEELLVYIFFLHLSLNHKGFAINVFFSLFWVSSLAVWNV